MELEITIKVPLAAAGASVSATQVVEGATSDEIAHEPPSPAAFGLVPSAASADAAPPSIDLMAQIPAGPGSSNGPPGLEDFPAEQTAAGRLDPTAGPPNLPPGAPFTQDAPPSQVDGVEPPE